MALPLHPSPSSYVKKAGWQAVGVSEQPVEGIHHPTTPGFPPPGGVIEFLAATEGLGGRFFQQNIITGAQGGGSVFEVIGILRGDDQHIRQPPGCEEIPG